ncbi:MAG TPA: hypothetical protein VD994_00365 [Prosthecobacter sp.]|nr:hypothetical protein [Prosthecobacter sp.]
MKRKLQALAVLLLFGVAKVPVEAYLTRQLLAAKLLNPPVDMGMRENLGQMGFAATLGGLRSLIASVTYLQAAHEWELVNWGKVDQLFQITTRLQPRFPNYWDEAAWHMASNAASSYLTNEKLDPALRTKLAEQHFRRGLEIIHEGLRVLPRESKLWVRQAEIYDLTRVPGMRDHAKAGDAYLKAYECSNFALYARLAGYQYAQTNDPNLWRKAHLILLDAYRKRQRPPSVISTLKSLEERLNIPVMQRIPDVAPRPPLRR